MLTTPLYMSPRVVVTPQMVSIDGRSYAVSQIAGVQLVDNRSMHRWMFKFGLVLLAPLLLASVGSANPGVILICGAIGFLGLVPASIGGIALLYGRITKNGGISLWMSMSDASTQGLSGLDLPIAFEVKAAIENAISHR
jgi:Family of unknown function (DUF6232)